MNKTKIIGITVFIIAAVAAYWLGQNDVKQPVKPSETTETLESTDNDLVDYSKHNDAIYKRDLRRNRAKKPTVRERIEDALSEKGETSHRYRTLAKVLYALPDSDLMAAHEVYEATEKPNHGFLYSALKGRLLRKTDAKVREAVLNMSGDDVTEFGDLKYYYLGMYRNSDLTYFYLGQEYSYKESIESWEWTFTTMTIEHSLFDSIDTWKPKMPYLKTKLKAHREKVASIVSVPKGWPTKGQ